MGWILLVALLGIAFVIFFAILRSRRGRPASGGPLVNVVKGTGEFRFDIVGESHYQEALASIAGPKDEDNKRHPCVAALVLEDNNPHDPQAVRVDIDDQTVGYLDRKSAREYRAEIARQGMPTAQLHVAALIVGGWNRGAGDVGSYGVKLDLPLVE